MTDVIHSLTSQPKPIRSNFQLPLSNSHFLIIQREQVHIQMQPTRAMAPYTISAYIVDRLIRTYPCSRASLQNLPAHTSHHDEGLLPTDVPHSPIILHFLPILPPSLVISPQLTPFLPPNPMLPTPMSPPDGFFPLQLFPSQNGRHNCLPA